MKPSCVSARYLLLKGLKSADFRHCVARSLQPETRELLQELPLERSLTFDLCIDLRRIYRRIEEL